MDTPINNASRFVLATITVADGKKTFPLTLDEVRSQLTNTTLPAVVTEDLMASFGYFLIFPTEAPAGDVVTEVAPVYSAQHDRFEQTFTVREFTEEEKQQRLADAQAKQLSSITPLRNQALIDGAAIDFGTTFGVQHVQMRDGDRANIIGLRLDSEGHIAAGDAGGYTGIRTRENGFVPITHTQMVLLSTLVMNAYKLVMKASWDLEDLVLASTSIDEIPALPGSFAAPVQVLTPTE